MKTLCIILARAGSKGLPNKNILDLAGQPMIAWTIGHAKAATRLSRIVVSSDDRIAIALASHLNIDVVHRPAELASDTATVDSAARHALLESERLFNEKYDAIVILYGNVPLRPADLIDRAVEKLAATRCDSVQSVAPVGKMHPYWMKKLTGPGGDVLEHYQPNHIYRRQDLPPVYMLDGGIIAVTRASLMSEKPGEPHAFLGTDRRAIVTQPGEVVDIDTAEDMTIASARMESKLDQNVEAFEDELDYLGWATVEIRGKKIGERESAYVVAELGVNHDGSRDKALWLTRQAKEAGADAVKLQLFDARLLLSAEAVFAEYQEGAATDPVAMLNALQIDERAMLAVRDLAQELGMAFIVTCFSLELVEVLRRLDVDAIKVASPDAVNIPLITAAMQLQKPLILATGTCHSDEIEFLYPLLARRPAVLLHCVSSYPTPDDRINLSAIADLRHPVANPSIGLSDHTTNVHTGMAAVIAGAQMLEKHLTYDRAARGPDHAASLDPAQFAEYVRLVRLAEKMRGEREFGRPQDIELDVRRVSRQSVCAVRDLPVGHVIRREDVTVKRPGTGIPAARLADVVGKPTLRAVKANHLLHEGDVEI